MGLSTTYTKAETDFLIQQLEKKTSDKYNDEYNSIANDIIKFIDINTGENVNYREITTWHDGSAMTDAKVDGVIFKKINNKFYQRKIENSINPFWWGEKTEESINNAINWASRLKLNVDILDDYEIDCSSDESGVQLKNNVTINFKGGRLLAKALASGNYRIINIYHNENVKIINPVIVGERNNHIGTTGEWGHGISITNSKNILIENPNIKDCWGDGIYIGNKFWDNVSDYSTEGITITNAVIDNVRRNGISITSNKNVTVINPRITRTNGVMPQAGIDIEPEGADGKPIVIDNINIINPYTADNDGAGILLFVTDAVLPENNPKIDINIHNHIDERSKFGFFSAKVRDGLSGCVNIINPSYISNQQGAILISNWGKENTIKLNIENPKLKGWNTSLDTFDFYRHGINIIKESTEEYANVGINIKNPLFDYTGADSSTKPLIVSSANPNKTSVLIDGIDDIKNGLSPFVITKGVLVKDYKGILKGNLWETTSEINFIRPNGFYSVNSNKNASGNSIFKVAELGWIDGQRFTVLIERSAWTTILFDGNNLYDSEHISSTRLSSNQLGAKITLEYNSGKFFVVEKNGLWSTNDRINQYFRVGTTEPENPYYPMIWFDLTSNKVKRRNEDNTGWIAME